MTNFGQRYFTIFKSDGHVTSSKQQHGRKGASSVVPMSANCVCISFRRSAYKFSTAYASTKIEVYTWKFITVKNNKKKMGEGREI